MSKDHKKDDHKAHSHHESGHAADGYESRLLQLQVELVKMQRHIIAEGRKLLIILEGRDGAGKDGTIQRITENLSPRDIRIVALPKPSDVEATQWYFQRYVAHLPAAGEIVLFNRSWYNRAGVEKVMGFCTDGQYKEFMRTVTVFENMLAESGISIIKYYLDIDRQTQKKRLEARRQNPLKQWKISPVDEKSLKYFDDYTKARDAMLKGTDSAAAPWVIIRAGNKKAARLGLIADLITRVTYKDEIHYPVEEGIAKRFDETCLTDGTLAH